jgi:biotin carboxylase
MRILFLDDQTKQALHVLRIIKNKFDWTIDVYSPGKPLVNYCYYSKYLNNFFAAPHINKDTYITTLKSILRSGNYNQISCFSDDIIYTISTNEQLIQRYIRNNLLIPGKESIILATDKNQMSSFVKKLGIPVPRYTIPNSVAELKRKASPFGYPVVIKGERGTGAYNVRFAKNDEELLELYLEILDKEKKYNGKPSIQEFIRGNGFLVHVLCYNGDLLRFCIHEKIAQYPPKAGVTTVGRTIFKKRLLEYTSEIFKRLNWNGLANVDFILDESNDEFLFLEINPRISGSIIVTEFAHTKMIEAYCNLIQGKKVRKMLHFKENVTVRFLFPREILYLFANPSYHKTFVSRFLAENTYTDVDWHDFKPSFREIGETLFRVGKEVFFKKERYHEVKR